MGCKGYGIHDFDSTSFMSSGPHATPANPPSPEAATSDIHWIIPSIAIALATMGIFFIMLTIFNFLADNYGPYASSAIAAQSFCRNALGGCFPLVTRQMYTNLGYGPASSLCGGIASVLGLVPIILIFYGDKIRERSKFAKSIAS